MDLLETLKPKEEEIADYPLEERLEQEEQYLGVCCQDIRQKSSKTRLAKQTQLVHELVENQPTKLLIYVKNIRTIRTKRENKWPLLMGMIQQEVFTNVVPNRFRQLRQSVEKGQVYYVEGKSGTQYVQSRIANIGSTNRKSATSRNIN